MDKIERKLDSIFKLRPRLRSKKEETHKRDVSLFTYEVFLKILLIRAIDRDNQWLGGAKVGNTG